MKCLKHGAFPLHGTCSTRLDSYEKKYLVTLPGLLTGTFLVPPQLVSKRASQYWKVTWKRRMAWRGGVLNCIFIQFSQRVFFVFFLLPPASFETKRVFWLWQQQHTFDVLCVCRVRSRQLAPLFLQFRGLRGGSRQSFRRSLRTHTHAGSTHTPAHKYKHQATYIGWCLYLCAGVSVKPVYKTTSHAEEILKSAMENGRTVCRGE